MGVDIVTSLPTVTRNREIGDSSASWQLRRPSPGHGRLPRILGGQWTGNPLVGIRQQTKLGEQGLIQYQLVLPGYMDTINLLTNTKNRS